MDGHDNEAHTSQPTYFDVRLESPPRYRLIADLTTSGYFHDTSGNRINSQGPPCELGLHSSNYPRQVDFTDRCYP